MNQKYNNGAQRLAQQKKQRMRVIKRRKIGKAIGAAVLVIALSVGMTYLFIKADSIEWENDQNAVAAYRAEMNEGYVPTAEEIAQANKEYIEDFYSPTTISDLKASILKEYGVLIDLIVENETLKVNSDVKPLDSNRLDKTINQYGNFKINCEQDKVDYTKASEEQRINKASSLYHTEQDVLEAKLIELNQKSKYLAQGSEEYTKNQEEIENVNRQLNSIKTAFDEIGDRSLTIYFENQRAEEAGKQK